MGISLLFVMEKSLIIKIRESLDFFKFKSGSDCEVILPLIEKEGLSKACNLLDGEFSFVIWDNEREVFIAGRDPIGIRPMFYGKRNEEVVAFASEAKALISICDEIKPFPPGCFLMENLFLFLILK